MILKGKIIVRLAGYSGHLDAISTSFKKFNSIDLKGLKNAKNNTAKQLGALAIVEVNTTKNISLNWGGEIPVF